MIGLEEAAEVIVREVSTVVGARRASIFAHDTDRNLLRPVAGWGHDVDGFQPIPIDDPHSVSARVFRECRGVAGDARALGMPRREQKQPYRGESFLSIPIVYPDPDGVPRPVGVINLTDRLGADHFTENHRKLVAAIGHQIGATMENARLVQLDRQRQRVRYEMELAHDLQMKLLPPPSIAGPDFDLAVRCTPGEVVGGDFYNLVPLPDGTLGIMIGDVSTHGFSAALIMALVLSAAGIHAAAAESPEGALERLRASIPGRVGNHRDVPVPVLRSRRPGEGRGPLRECRAPLRLSPRG